MVQCYLRRLEDSVHPVMTEGQFAMKLFPVYRYFVTVWQRSGHPEVRCALYRGALWSSQVTIPQPVDLGRLRDHRVQPHSINSRAMGTD